MNKYKCMGMLLLISILAGGCQKAEPVAEETKAPVQEIAKEEEKASTRELKEEPEPKFIAEGIRRVKLTKDSEVLLDIAYEPKEYESSYEYWKVKAPYGGEAVLDTEAALKFYGQLAQLSFTQVTEVGAEVKENLASSKTYLELEFCQLDESDESSSYKAEASSRLTLTIGEEDGAGNYYTTLSGDPERVYLISVDALEQIFAVKPYDLILKISAVCPMETVSAVETKVAGKSKKLENYQEIYTDLFGVLIAGELKEPAKGEKEELLTLTFARTAPEMEKLTITYYDYDKEYASVKVKGEEHFLVEKAEVENLIKITQDN
ncbi:hypothetical protein M2146_002159 [Lachnospiraceae bacterium PF1-22]|uniref:DUF4340 domain-containing protein n=1 Tax=Ohessyouella blattaphilus TaxID=2949333 RepID=UPI003E2C200B